MFRIHRGLDLPLAGTPVQAIGEGRVVSRVALLGADYPGTVAALRVQPGEALLRGQLVFEDRKAPGLRFTSPAKGRVVAIHRGERRALLSVEIAVDADDGPDAQERFDRGDLKAGLVASGLWTALRTRPFSRVPPPQAIPQAIFVTAMDTRPLAASVEVALAGREEDFARGLAALTQLTPGTVHVCRAPGGAWPVPKGERIAVHEFQGPHPAGNPGTHIHFIHPVGPGRSVWHVAAADVAAIGAFAATGRVPVERVVSLAGPGVANPRLVRTRLGASLDELCAGELRPGEQRVVSGSVLDGRRAMGPQEGYLGRYHAQVSVLPEGRGRELLGWIAPGTGKHSVTGAVLGAFSRRLRPFTTTTNGSLRAMVPIGTYESVMPLDILPTFLLRSLLTGDAERAEQLGALELDEEDLALCTYACPGKHDYGPLLREVLERLRKEGVA